MLDIEHNPITAIHHTAFKGTRISMLILAYTRLNHIPDAIHPIQNTLMRLDMSYTPLTHIQSGIFDNMKIIYLNLEGTLLQIIPGEVIALNETLQILNVLHMPETTDIEVHAFCRLQQMKDLSLIKPKGMNMTSFELFVASLKNLTKLTSNVITTQLGSTLEKLTVLKNKTSQCGNIPNMKKLLCSKKFKLKLLDFGDVCSFILFIYYACHVFSL